MARTFKKANGKENERVIKKKKVYNREKVKREQLVEFRGRIMTHSEMLETKSNFYR